MFKIGIAGIIITLLLHYLRHDFVKQQIRKYLHLESNWWIDAVTFYLIPVAGLVALTALILTHNARETAERELITLKEQAKALDPYRQPITDFNASIWVAIKPNADWKVNIGKPGAFVWFMQGEEKLIALTTRETTLIQNLTEYVNYHTKVTFDMSKALLGKPISSLKNIEIIKIYVPALPDSAEVIGGGISCVINGALPLNFPIPSQRANRTEIIISDTKGQLQALEP